METYALQYFGDRHYISIEEYLKNEPFFRIKDPTDETLTQFMDRTFPVEYMTYFGKLTNLNPELDETDLFWFLTFEVAVWSKKLRLELYENYALDITIRNNNDKEYVILRDKIDLTEEQVKLVGEDMENVHMRAHVHLIRFDESKSHIYPELNGNSEFVLHL